MNEKKSPFCSKVNQQYRLKLYSATAYQYESVHELYQTRNKQIQWFAEARIEKNGYHQRTLEIYHDFLEMGF